MRPRVKRKQRDEKEEEGVSGSRTCLKPGLDEYAADALAVGCGRSLRRWRSAAEEWSEEDTGEKREPAKKIPNGSPA